MQRLVTASRACMRFRGKVRDDFTFGDVSETYGRRGGGRGGVGEVTDPLSNRVRGRLGLLR